jgi:site-specific recombinase XerD
LILGDDLISLSALSHGGAMKDLSILTKVSTPIIVNGISFNDPGFDEYLQEELHVKAWLSQKRSSGTRRNYEREVRQFFKKFPGLLIKNVSDKHIIAYLVERRELSAASQNFAKNVLSSLLRYCVRIRYIPFNIAEALDPIRVPDQIAFRSLTEAQVRRLLECSRRMPPRNHLLIKLLFYTGMRVAEIVSLRWSNFRISADKTQISVVGKGGRVRSILINKALSDELSMLKTDRNEKPSSHVFISQMEPHSGISTKSAWRIVKEAVISAKLPLEISPHYLRHAHAVLALKGGAPLATLQQTLGHASLKTTGIYLTHFPEESSGDFLPEL